jgi:hypothetical protein
MEQSGAARPLLQKILRRAEARLGKALPFRLIPGRKLAYPDTPVRNVPSYPSKIDFMAGVAAQAEMVSGKSPAFYTGAVSLHITELALALHHGLRQPQPYKVKNLF